MSDNSIKTIMDTTMDKLRAMVDADTIIGTPLTVGEITLIPVSKVAFGLATGGSDFPSKNQQQLFGGGGGAGVTVTPVAFIAVSGDSVKMMPIYNELTSLDKAINMAPELIEKVKELFPKNKEHNIPEL
ncbi:MAG: GerW family sporulation protein [Clostridia bacterium]|nr:GerW family sporulation protein [Clostridia bacterium]MBQ2237410.1 GerW family sporulation protein [Clostridia bacterium]MEE1185079.1 GerW family sporulation protein [Acutalibacteraceae bacterium]